MTSDNRAATMWEEMEALLRERENDAGEEKDKFTSLHRQQHEGSKGQRKTIPEKREGS